MGGVGAISDNSLHPSTCRWFSGRFVEWGTEGCVGVVLDVVGFVQSKKEIEGKLSPLCFFF
jgi:hypothetical protein